MGNQVHRARRPPPRFTGTRLRQLRLLARLTQQELAAQVPVHRVTLARWECGMRPISAAAEARLHTVFQEVRRAYREEQRAYRPEFHWAHDFDPWQ
jgi:transcriptional regulator with XRE-family HTH domain